MIRDVIFELCGRCLKNRTPALNDADLTEVLFFNVKLSFVVISGCFCDACRTEDTRLGNRAGDRCHGVGARLGLWVRAAAPRQCKQSFAEA